jgi:ABC-type nitrate/sulfonate/bicarbonate transport system substrate-binding protein
MTIVKIAAGLAAAALCATAARAQTEIRMGFLSQDIAPFCVNTGTVHEEGLSPFKPEGPLVKLRKIQITVSQAPVMVSNGDLDTAECAGPSGLAQAWSKGGKNAVVVFVGSAKPAYVLIGGKNATTLADLKGKVVGSPGPQSTATEASTLILGRGAHLVAEKDYKLVSAGTGSARTAALMAGKIDAVPSFPPFSYRMVDDGFHVIGDEADYVPKYVSGAIIVNRAWAAKNADALVALLKTFLQTGEWMRDPSKKEAVIAAMAKTITEGGRMMGLEHARLFYRDVVEGGRIALDGYADAEAFQSNFDIMVERGAIARAALPKPADIVDFSYLNRARRELGLAEVPAFK